VTAASAPSGGRGLTLWLGLLCTLALVAAVRALLLPPWPRAAAPQAASLSAALRREGVSATALAPRPQQRSAERDLSVAPRWRLAGGDTLQLNGVAVRRWPDWQVAAFTSGVPALALRERRFSPAWPGTAIGSLQGRLALQTCLVPQPAGPALPAVTREALSAMLKRSPLNPSQRLRILLGLRPAYPLSCTLLTLRAAAGVSAPPPSWRAVLQAVTAELPPAAP